MDQKTFHDSLMPPQAETRRYGGKLILKKDEFDWYTSPQGSGRLTSVHLGPASMPSATN